MFLIKISCPGTSLLATVEMMLSFSRPLQSSSKKLPIVMRLKQSKEIIVFSLKKQTKSPAYGAYWRGNWLAGKAGIQACRVARGCCAWLRRDSCPHGPQALWAASSFPGVGENGLQSFSLLRCFSWCFSTKQRIYPFFPGEQPCFLVGFFLINLQVLSA